MVKFRHVWLLIHNLDGINNSVYSSKAKAKRALTAIVKDNGWDESKLIESTNSIYYDSSEFLLAVTKERIR